MEKLYRIALGMVYGIGSIGARRIMSYAGSAEAAFRLTKVELMAIPGVGAVLADRFLGSTVIEKARKELDYINSIGINCLFSNEKSTYPEMLGHCEDAPIVLYSRGKLDIDGKKTLSVVGTRRPTSYGMDMCRKIIKDLARRYPDLVVVSGLAYGIDQCAHRTALECGIPTIAVLGHGFRYMYPASHRRIAGEIESAGALVTDFPSFEKPERKNFIKRNRIIAGLSEATIVIESGKKGGALVTADLAGSYHREVFAFPGRSGDPSAAGCNGLIKSHRAALIEDYRDIEYQLGWEQGEDLRSGFAEKEQGNLFRDLKPEEKSILSVLRSEGDSSVDMICYRTGLSINRIAGILMELELAGIIEAIPGNCYRLLR